MSEAHSTKTLGGPLAAPRRIIPESLSMEGRPGPAGAESSAYTIPDSRCLKSRPVPRPEKLLWRPYREGPSPRGGAEGVRIRN